MKPTDADTANAAAWDARGQTCQFIILKFVYPNLLIASHSSSILFTALLTLLIT